MQQSNQPAKFILPIAQNDPSKADIPVTTGDATRASQSLGFPPLTGQPPEAGGVPPQLPDMNGLLNAISRIPWWAMLGGRFGYDAVFATDTNINGYPLGAELASADGLGSYFSTANNNTSNPDTSGAGWVPASAYGATALTGLTGGNVTLTQAQAAKTVITVAGTLTSNLVLIVPGWRYQWTVYNNTSGSFSVSVRTASGSVAAIPQNSAPTPVLCDGTNCSLLAPNIAAATSDSQAVRLDQVGGRLLNVQRITASGTYTPTTGANRIVVELVGGGGAGGGVPVTTTQAATGSGGGAGGYVQLLIDTVPSSVAVTIGAGGVGAAGLTGGTGGASSSFGAFVTVAGGQAGTSRQSDPSIPNFATAGGPGGAPTVNSGMPIRSQWGAPGTVGLSLGGGAYQIGGEGGISGFGAATTRSPLDAGGNAPPNSGAGGGGATAASNNLTARAGGNGGSGVCVVWEYA